VRSASPRGAPRPAPIATSWLLGHEDSDDTDEVEFPEFSDPAVMVLRADTVIVWVTVTDAVAAVTVTVASDPARSARGSKVALFHWKVFD
jgi:hypothetical protein